MANNVVPFDRTQVPAYIQDLCGSGNSELSSGIRASYGVISIKGKEWAINEGGEIQTITDENDNAVRTIDVVIVRASQSISKVYYTKGWTDGSAAAPTCMSSDGISPSLDAEEPQAKKCAVCPHNAWGSRISENGSKGKACSDNKRLAVAFLDDLENPLLLRVPPATFKDLRAYASDLEKRSGGGAKFFAVLTRLGFLKGVPHPQITFTPLGYLPAETIRKVLEVRDSDIVQAIIGAEAVHAEAEAEAPAALPPAPAPAPAQRPARQVVQASRDEVEEIARAANEDTEEAPAPVRRGRGRPAGSRNKPVEVSSTPARRDAEDDDESQAPKPARKPLVTTSLSDLDAALAALDDDDGDE